MSRPSPHVAVIGAGPAGLIAAEKLARAGLAVTVHEAMPSVGRKFLMAGRGGLNLTHAEPLDKFLRRYGTARRRLTPMVEAFPPAALIGWANGLGQATFTGTSGRVFPVAMKASPLLRAWLQRLHALDVRIETRRRWLGWDADDALVFDDAPSVKPDATILALGGASWPKLGSDGAWAPLLAARGVDLAPFRPANCGFSIEWTDVFRDRFAGAPLKGARFIFGDRLVRGEAVITRAGIEGGAIYALSSAMRDAIDADGVAHLTLDLRPDTPEAALSLRLRNRRKGESDSSLLRRVADLSPLAINLLRETHGLALPKDPAALARAVKHLPLRLHGAAPIDRAISSAGGITFEAVDEHLQLRAAPGVFVAGEMLDWEAPTGGYLLQACFATGVAVAKGVLAHVGRR